MVLTTASHARASVVPAYNARMARRSTSKKAITRTKEADTNSSPLDTAREIRARLAVLPNHGTAPMRAVRCDFSRQLAKSGASHVLAVARALLRPAGTRWIAYELVQHHPDAMAQMGAKELEEFGHGIDSWGAVDCFSCFLAGPAWQARQVPDSVIHGWARSPDRWWRRAALVATVGLNCKARGGFGDTPRTLRVCRMLAADRDDMVVKAMSWALRELSKRDPQAVREFLASQPVAARVVREVKNKLTTGLKNPR
jgi:3-methyladenine DNA glycosylase AlkD